MPADVGHGSGDALTALRALRSEGEVPAVSQRRVMDRLAVTLALAPCVLQGAPPPAPPLASHVVSGAGSRLRALARPWLSRAVWLLSGAAIGAGVQRGFDRTRVESRIERPAEAVPAAAAETVESPAEPELPVVAPMPSQRVPTAASTAPRRDRTTELAQERALLDAARRSWAEGDATACLTKLDDHARSFRKGQLAEERDALRINALVATGQHAMARGEATLFLRTYPRSFLAPSVEAALEAIP